MIITTNTAVTLLCYYSLPSQTVVQATHSPLPARYCSYNFGRAQMHVHAHIRACTPARIRVSAFLCDDVSFEKNYHVRANVILNDVDVCEAKINSAKRLT